MDEEFPISQKKIKEEIEDIVNGYDYPITLEKGAVLSMMYDLVKVFQKIIDERVNKLVVGKDVNNFVKNVDVLEELQEIKVMLK